MAARYGAAAAAQPVAGYAAVAGYGRDYADPYLGHGIGPMAGYGVRKYTKRKSNKSINCCVFCRRQYIEVVTIDLHHIEHICSSIFLAYQILHYKLIINFNNKYSKLMLFKK